MRPMDDSGLLLCKYQASLFEYSAKQQTPSKMFIKRFSMSNLAKRMDGPGFIYEGTDVPKAFEEIKTQKTNDPKLIYSQPIISWIGYIYRYMSYIYEKPTTLIYKKIPPQELYDVYDAYHSLDNEMAINRILEAKSINLDVTADIELFKRIYLNK